MRSCRHVQLIPAEPGWRMVSKRGYVAPIIAWALCETFIEADGTYPSAFEAPDGKETEDPSKRGRYIHAVVLDSRDGGAVCEGDLRTLGNDSFHHLAPGEEP